MLLSMFNNAVEYNSSLYFVDLFAFLTNFDTVKFNLS